MEKFWDEKAAEPEAITPGGQWADSCIAANVDDLMRTVPGTGWARILDVGCGEGRLLKALAARAEEYVGVDVSSVALERAQKVVDDNGIANARLVKVDGGRNIPSSVGEFDVVVSWTVFMHMPTAEMLKWWDTIRRITRDGGTFAFQLNHRPDFVKANMASRFDHVADGDYWTGRWYPEWLVSDMLHAHGFDVVGMPGGRNEAWVTVKGSR